MFMLRSHSSLVNGSPSVYNISLNSFDVNVLVLSFVVLSYVIVSKTSYIYYLLIPYTGR